MCRKVTKKQCRITTISRTVGIVMSIVMSAIIVLDVASGDIV